MNFRKAANRGRVRQIFPPGMKQTVQVPVRWGFLLPEHLSVQFEFDFVPPDPLIAAAVVDNVRVSALDKTVPKVPPYCEH